MGLICALFFGSGFAALVYQLLWFRHFGFVFGNTVYAATTVIAAFMVGLAWGAHFWGKRADALRHPLRAFALLELSIGIYAALMPWMIGGVRALYRWAYLHATDDMGPLTLLRFVLAFAAMILPTFLMGGTLPVLSKALIRSEHGFSGRLGLIYGINTLGAMSGILSAGFILLPSLGLTGTTVTAISVNFLVAMGAFVLSRNSLASLPQSVPVSEEPTRPMQREALVVSVGIALSGFVALAFEVLWFRALILVFGSTTYSFCTMLGIYLAGVALGPLTLGWLADKIQRPAALFALLQCFIGLYVFLSLHWFDDQAEWLLTFLVQHEMNWSTMTMARFLIAAKFLLVPTFLMGLSFPVAARALWSLHGKTGASVGSLYAINTLGDIGGALVGGFILLPWLGLSRALTTLASLSFVIVLVMLLAPMRRSLRTALAAVALAGLILTLWRPPVWTPEIIASGPYFSPWNYVQGGRITFWERLNRERLIYFKEGVTATASVTLTDDDEYYFSMDGKVEADTSSRGMLVQRMIGHLPMLFHPNPKAVMNLGLGAGVTFGALSCYPVDHLEVVEIEPAVTNVARIWGARNHNVIDRTNAIVTINDGRNHLFCTPQSYDVITSDPYEPVVGGASHLFTVDHFKGARERLNPGGIMCQWVPMYEMSQEDYLTIIRSFVRVFPESALFFTGVDSLLLGFRDDLRLNPDTVREKFALPAVKASLAEVGIGSPDLLLSMLVSDLRKAPIAQQGRVNTDDQPVIEFSTPRHAVRYTPDRNQEILLSLFNDLPEDFMVHMGPASRTQMVQSHEALRYALRANILRGAGDPNGAFALLTQAQQMAPANPVIRNEVAVILRANGEALMDAGRMEEAAGEFQSVLSLVPGDFAAHAQLVHIAMMTGHPDLAGQVLDEACRYYPNSAVMLALRGKYLAATGRLPEAMIAFGEAVSLRPDRPDIWEDYARALATAGQPEESQKALTSAQAARDLQFPRH